MTTVTLNKLISLQDLQSWDLTNWQAYVTAATPTDLEFTNGTKVLALHGIGLTYSSGIPVSGVVTAIEYRDGTAVLEVSNANYDIAVVAGFIDAENVDGLIEYIFADADTINGSPQNDVLGGFGNNDALYGNGGNDTLSGGSGNDWLEGGAGTDTLAGGAGNDTYVVESADDTVLELTGEGIDLVRTSISYVLGANVEQLLLTGTNAVNGTGNALANTLTGNSAANTLYGLGGADTLSGKQGADALYGGAGNDLLDGGVNDDQMHGGAGNDTYIVDSTGDLVLEYTGEGTDLVKSAVTYTLGDNVENLTLTGSFAISGTGNTLSNVMIGNGFANVLDGKGGTDDMRGGAGNDTYYVDNTADKIAEGLGAGTDQVYASASHALSANVEHLTLLAGATNGTGNALANTITGNAANNVLAGQGGNDRLRGEAGDDTLNGGAGVDTLVGGAGNDTYIVDLATDVVVEAFNSGNDTVRSSTNYTLSAYVENLELTGAGSINGTGNSMANVMTGNGGRNVLAGGDGNDTISGLGGNDSLNGGNGNDTLNGGEGDDELVGGFGTDTLIGGAGSDTLNGGAAKDLLTGGLGADVFAFSALTDSVAGVNRDMILDFNSVELDKIDLRALDANTQEDGQQSFSFIDGAAFTGAGQARFQDGVLYVNVNDTLAADFSIRIEIGGAAVTSLVATDLILA